MDLKAVIEGGTEAVADQVEKVTSSISPGLTNLAESPIAKQIVAIVSAAGAKAHEKLESHEDDTPQAVAEPAEAPATGSNHAAGLASTGDVSEASGSGSRKTLLIGGSILLAGATAAAAVVVYRRRRGSHEQASESDEDTEGAVVTPIKAVVPDDSAAADSTEAADQEQQGAASADKESQMTDQGTVEASSDFAAALDAEAEHFVQDFIDHIDDEDEIVDLDYVVEIDAEADHFAQELVDHIEVTDEDLAAEEELEKKA